MPMINRRCPKCASTAITRERQGYAGGSSGDLECTNCGEIGHFGDFDVQKQLDERFISDLRLELARARAKFPSAAHSVIALTEEVGELAQAVLKVAAGKWEPTRVFAEAVQVAAMAMRVAIEDDASLIVTAYTEPGA